MENSYLKQDIETLKNRAEAGDADAQELYGTAFDEGNGVDMNQEEAVKWYEQAANQGKLHLEAGEFMVFDILNGFISEEQ